MSTPSERPDLHFFRVTPKGLGGQPPLASSLQSLETALYLLSLERYPAALISCVSAWEGAIKAKLQVPLGKNVHLAKLLGQIRELLPALKTFDRPDLDQVREVRNEIVHYGFSPRDDQKCGRLLVDTAVPFLKALYREAFGFLLCWRDVRPGLTEFMQLTEEEASNVGLLPEVADQLHIVESMRELNRDHPDFNVLFCFTALSHYLRFGIMRSVKSYAQAGAQDRAEALGLRYAIESAEKDRFKDSLPGQTWEFDCPMCHGSRSVVAGLDDDSYRDNRVKLTWAVCVWCRFVIPRQAYHLADLVFAKDVDREGAQILAACPWE